MLSIYISAPFTNAGTQMCPSMKDCSPLKFTFQCKLLACECKWPHRNERKNMFYIIAAQKSRTISLIMKFKVDTWQSWLGILPIIFPSLLTLYTLLYLSEQHSIGTEKREHWRTAKHHYYCSNFTANSRYLWSVALQKRTCKTWKQCWNTKLRHTCIFLKPLLSTSILNCKGRLSTPLSS